MLIKGLVIITGPSGSGKSTLEKNLESLDRDYYEREISATTRPRRKHEKNGVHYHFMKPEKFLETKFVEYEKFLDHYYGIPASELTKTRRVLLACVESKGAQSLVNYINTHGLPISMIVVKLMIPPEIRQRNMLLRGDSQDKVDERLEKDTIFEELKTAQFPNAKILEYTELSPSLHLKVHREIKDYIGALE